MQYKPKSKTIADNASVNRVEEVAADCSRNFDIV